MPHYDVIVAGVGGMGSAVCYHLAKRGQRVLGLERFELGHAMGSSHGMSRIIRMAYFEGENYVPLCIRSAELWREAERESGLKLYHMTGSLDIAPEGAGFVEQSLASCLTHHLTHAVLDRAEIKKRFPAFNITPKHKALWQPEGGFIASEKAIYAHAGLAMKHGADLQFNEPILSWKATPDGGVEVRTERQTYTAGTLVLSTGAWMPDHVKALGKVEEVVKQTIGWFGTRKPELFTDEKFPVFILTVDEGNFYGFPSYEHPGVKIGGPHFAREAIDPNNPDRTPSATMAAAIQDFLPKYIPDISNTPIALRGCMYTLTPDEHFVVDRLPDAPQVIALSPCSGHGFKFCPVVGEITADLVTKGQTRHDIAPFAITRFAA